MEKVAGYPFNTYFPIVIAIWRVHYYISIFSHLEIELVQFVELKVQQFKAENQIIFEY